MSKKNKVQKQTDTKKKNSNLSFLIFTLVMILAAAAIFAVAYHYKKTGGQKKIESLPVEKPAAAQTLLQFQDPQPGSKVATIQTSMGDIKIMFFPEQAPKAVENFLTHAEQGYYDGVIFHRVIKDFMIQSGDPTGTGYYGESIWGDTFEDEFSDQLYNFRGALCMANTGNPDTNKSQFFIVQASSLRSGDTETMEENGYSQEVMDTYEEIGGTLWLDNVHTVFGQVIEGMNVVDAIANVKVTSYKPNYDVVIRKILVETVK